MILQELVRYYDRKADLAAEGWEHKEIPFVIVLGPPGSAHLVDRRSNEWKRGAPILLPASENRAGTRAWMKPNLLWDHYGFVLGQRKRLPSGDADPSDNPEKVANAHGAFKDRLLHLLERFSDQSSLQAIRDFYESDGPARLSADPIWDEMLKVPGANLTFQMAGCPEFVAQEPWVAQAISHHTEAPTEDGAVQGICLITGERGPVVRLPGKVPNVGAKPAALVAATTLENPAFSSYGLEQGLISPASPGAVSRYTTALRHLLAKDSRNRLRVGDTSTVFWADGPAPLLDGEFNLADLLGENKDNPDRSVQAVQALYQALRSGQLPVQEGDARFFVLGLAPNAARISVRYWIQGTVAELAPRILQHFEDLRVARNPERDPEAPSLYRLLKSLALQDKIDNVPPRLGGEWMRAVLEGLPYPAGLLNAAVIRCRAERDVPYLRAAILKAWLNRDHRRRHPDLPSDHAHFKEDLDMTQDDPAYRLGRLFAVLERIQHEAQGGINTTIRDRYYGAASTTPVVVFTTLLRLKNAHLKKLNSARSTWFERLVGEVFGSLESPALADFPRQLNLAGQGRFALGYYHQRQSLFTKKTDPEDATPHTPHTAQEA